MYEQDGLTNIKLKYISPAYPPKKIHVDWIYELGYDKSTNQYFIFDGNLTQYFSIDLLKQLFKPINHNWFEVIKEMKKQSNQKIIKYKNI